MKSLHLDILSPEKQVFSGEVESVTLPGTKGRFTILPEHAPIISSLAKGSLTYVSAGSEQKVDVSKGFVEMSGGTVTVCAELA